MLSPLPNSVYYPTNLARKPVKRHFLGRRVSIHQEAGAVLSGVCVNVSNGTKIPNAVDPVWRTSIMSNVIGVPYDPLNYQNNINAQNNVTNVLIPKLEALSPIQGAYLNEADIHQPNFQSVFYGNNYQTLKSIKNKYDPSSTFYGLTAVGSDDWTMDSVTGRLCPVS